MYGPDQICSKNCAQIVAYSNSNCLHTCRMHPCPIENFTIVGRCWKCKDQPGWKSSRIFSTISSTVCEYLQEICDIHVPNHTEITHKIHHHPTSPCATIAYATHSLTGGCDKLQNTWATNSTYYNEASCLAHKYWYVYQTICCTFMIDNLRCWCRWARDIQTDIYHT